MLINRMLLLPVYNYCLLKLSVHILWKCSPRFCKHRIVQTCDVRCATVQKQWCSPKHITHTHLFNGPFPWPPRWAGTRKEKPIQILLKQETVSGSGISWAICKSAPCSRQITMPAPHHSVFTDRMPFLPPNQQRQSTEGTKFQTYYTSYKQFYPHQGQIQEFALGRAIPFPRHSFTLPLLHFTLEIGSPYTSYVVWGVL